MKSLVSFKHMVALTILIASAPVFATKKIEIKALPSVVSALNPKHEQIVKLEERITGFIKYACEVDTSWRLGDICELPQKLETLQSYLDRAFTEGYPPFVTNSHVDANNLRPWDIQVLLSGQYFEVPTQDDVDGIQLLVDFLILRNEVLQGVLKLQQIVLKKNVRENTSSLLFAPIFVSYYLSHSPFGTGYLIFELLNCDDDKKICQNLKSTWGSVNAHSVSLYQQQLQDVLSRIEGNSLDQNRDDVERLNRIKALSLYVLNGLKEGLDRSSLMDQVTALVGSDDSGGNSSKALAELSIEMSVIAEIQAVESLMTRVSFYPEDLSDSSNQKMKSQLAPMLDEWIQSATLKLNQYARELSKGL